MRNQFQRQQSIFKDQHWTAFNNNSTNSINSLMHNTQTSFTSLLDNLRSLSVRNSTQFGTLPAAWLNTAVDKTQQQTSPQLFQTPQTPVSGDKRTGDTLMSEAQQQNKYPKLAVEKQTFMKAEMPGNDIMSTVKAKSSSHTRWNSWSHEEEVFLVVAVLDRFFRRGSLASSGKSNTKAQGADCWGEIKELYDTICTAWMQLPENVVKPELILRSTTALCRHFKIMKVRAVEGDKNGTHTGNFRKYLREWDTIYNLGGKLIPERF